MLKDLNDEVAPHHFPETIEESIMWSYFKKVFNIHVISVETGPVPVLQTIWCQFMKEFHIHVINEIMSFWPKK